MSTRGSSITSQMATAHAVSPVATREGTNAPMGQGLAERSPDGDSGHACVPSRLCFLPGRVNNGCVGAGNVLSPAGSPMIPCSGRVQPNLGRTIQTYTHPPRLRHHLGTAAGGGGPQCPQYLPKTQAYGGPATALNLAPAPKYPI